MLTACSNDDSDGPDTPGYKGIPLVILDADIGSSTDDLFSLEILCRYDDLKKCKPLGVVVDREGESCAACADVMVTYFGHGDVPIGLVRDGIKDPKVWIDYRDALPNAKNADGTQDITTTITLFLNNHTAVVIYHKFRKCRIPVNIPEQDYYNRVYDLLSKHGRELKKLGIRIDAWAIDANGTPAKAV